MVGYIERIRRFWNPNTIWKKSFRTSYRGSFALFVKETTSNRFLDLNCNPGNETSPVTLRLGAADAIELIASLKNAIEKLQMPLSTSKDGIVAQ